MKKSICLFVMCCILMNHVASFAQNTESESAGLEDALVLSDLGLMDLSGSGSQEITRSRFCQVLVKTLNVDFFLNYDIQYFNDVPKKHEGFQQITYAVINGYVSGYQDQTFRPDEPISITEATTVYVSVLGYRYRAEQYGGYPAGYERCAREIGLLKGLKGAFQEPLTIQGLSKLVRNTFDIPLVLLSGIGEEDRYTVKQDVTLLTHYLKLHKGSGLVTATDTAAVLGSETVYENQLEIDGLVFPIKEDAHRNLLGMKVDYIYKMKEGSGQKQLVSLRKSSDNMEFDIDIEEFIRFQDNRLYYERGGKTYFVSISKTADIIRNGKNIPYEEGMFDQITYGGIRVVSTGQNKVFDVIFVNEYDNLVVGNTNPTEQILSDKDEFSRQVNFNQEDRVVLIFDFEGNKLQFSDISLNDVVTFLESESYLEAYVGARKETGLIEAKNEADNELTVGGKVLKLSPGIIGRYSYLRPGQKITYQLDYLGNIADFSSFENSSGNYYYLIELESRETRFEEETIIAKCYATNKGIIKLMFASKFELNGRVMKNPSFQQIRSLLAAGDASKIDQLVSLSLNQENEIVSLSIAKNISEFSSGEDGFCKTHSKLDRTLLKSGPTFDFDIYFYNNTPILLIPENVAAAEDHEFDTLYATDLEDYQVLAVEAYTNSKEAEYSDVLILRESVSSSKVPAVKTPLSVFVKKTSALSQDGGIIQKIYYVKNGTEGYTELYPEDQIVYTYLQKDYRPENMKPGDVFTFQTTRENRMNRFKLYYQYEDHLWTTAEIHTAYKGTERNTRAQVSKIDSNFIFFSRSGYSDQRYKTSKFNVIVVDAKNGVPKVRVGSLSDAEIGDKAVIQVVSRALTTIVLYKY